MSEPNFFFGRAAMNTFKVLCVYDMTLVLLKLNGKILMKCLRAVLEMLFMYCLDELIKSRSLHKSNRDMDQYLLILSRKCMSWHSMTLSPPLDSRRRNHCERHTRFSVCNVSKQNRASLTFIHSHRDLQNVQDSYLNRLLRLNIYLSRFYLRVMTYF